jgi:hypothetical protein
VAVSLRGVNSVAQDSGCCTELPGCVKSGNFFISFLGRIYRIQLAICDSCALFKSIGFAVFTVL